MTRRIDASLSAMLAATLLLSTTSASAAPASAAPAAKTPAAKSSAPATTTTTPPVAADPNSPDALSDEAITRFKAKDYDGAVEFFGKAYEIDPKPNYLFNIGRVYEEAGKLPEAVTYYERFVREPGVDLESREITLQRLRVLRAIIAETAPKEPPKVERIPEPEPEPVRVEPEPEPEPERVPPKIRKLRIAGATVAGIGGAGVVLGAIFGGIARRQANELATTDGYSARQELIRVGHNNAVVADVAFLTGGILAVTGAVLLLTTVRAKPRAADEARVVAPMLGQGRFGLALGGRF